MGHICHTCRKTKREIDFRLIKDTWLSIPRLCKVCIECERSKGAKICFRCNQVLLYADVFLSTPALTICRDCQTVDVIYRDIQIRKISEQLSKTIKKLNKMANTIDDLRGKLISTIDGLKDGSVTPEVAQSIDAIAKTIIESAKAETEFIRIAGGTGSGFIPVPNETKQLQTSA